MIKVSNLTKFYGEHKALENLSFELAEGKIYGFLGPNGAGKTTTLNIITGYMGASSGSVSICGYDILEDALNAKKNLGYLPEIPPLYQDMTVSEYLKFISELKLIKKSEIKNHILEIEENTGLLEVSDRLIKHLSKGFRQRVGLAGALISYPKVLILDEPTVGLDPIQINEVRELILSLKGKCTILFSSHIIQEILAVCDEIIIIANGCLKAIGKPDELLLKYDEPSLEKLFIKLVGGES